MLSDTVEMFHPAFLALSRSGILAAWTSFFAARFCERAEPQRVQ